MIDVGLLESLSGRDALGYECSVQLVFWLGSEERSPNVT